MNPKIVIRSETDADIDAVTEVTVAAFKTLEISNNTEQFIIMALRAAKVLTVSLVAELDGRVIGHVAFSPVTISDGTPNWYGLGPVSVLPTYHRKGIGKSLIREGLSQLKDLNAAGCCVVGHPDYYRKLGSRMHQAFFMREYRKRCFSLCPSMDILPKARLIFTKDSKLMANKGLKATAHLSSVVMRVEVGGCLGGSCRIGFPLLPPA